MIAGRLFRGGLVIALCCLLAGCGKAPIPSSYSSTRFMLGTTVTIEIQGEVGAGQESLKEAADAAFERMQAISDQVDRYAIEEPSQGMQLSRLAGTGQWLEVDADIWRMLSQVKEIGREEVDLTLGPLVELWTKAAEDNQLPTEESLAQALALCGMDQIELDPAHQSVRLNQTKMSLDFGAVAKGYALEEAWTVLSNAPGVVRGLIDAGGNIKTLGEKADGTKWKIGLTDPADPSLLLGALNLEGGQAAATSGDYQRFYEIQGRRYNHIIHPENGWPVSHYHAVIAVTEDGFWSDYYSTLLFLLAEEEARELVEDTPQLEAIFIGADDHIFVSEGIKNKILWDLPGGYALDPS